MDGWWYVWGTEVVKNNRRSSQEEKTGVLTFFLPFAFPRLSRLELKTDNLNPAHRSTSQNTKTKKWFPIQTWSPLVSLTTSKQPSPEQFLNSFFTSFPTLTDLRIPSKRKKTRMVQTINLQCRIAFALLSLLRTLWALEDILRDVSHLDRFDDSSPIFSDSTTLSNSRSTLSSSPSLSTNAGVESGQYLLSDPILDTWLLSLTVDEWWLSHVRFFFFFWSDSHTYTHYRFWEACSSKLVEGWWTL